MNIIKKQEIKKIMENNGNENFTHKELLWYLVSKIDNLIDNYNVQINTCSDKFTSKKTFYWFGGIIITLICSIASLVLLGGLK